MPDREIIYFDLETKRSAQAVGGWGNKAEMGISVAVTYSTKTGQYHMFTEERSLELIQQLQKADMVVGYNHLYFDYAVLQGHTILDLESATHNLDLMLDIESRIKVRLKLESVAAATLGLGKIADGMQALRWWTEYEKTNDTQTFLKIAEYCAYDVKVTKCVHEFGIQNGYVLYQDKSSQLQRVEVDW